MKRDDALALLRTHQEEIVRRFDVGYLALFGSVARDEAGPESDVDVLVEFVGPITWDRYWSLLEFLEELLGTRVDLVTTTGLKPRVRPYVERDLIRVA